MGIRDVLAMDTASVRMLSSRSSVSRFAPVSYLVRRIIVWFFYVYIFEGLSCGVSFYCYLIFLCYRYPQMSIYSIFDATLQRDFCIRLAGWPALGEPEAQEVSSLEFLVHLLPRSSNTILRLC